MGYSFMGTIMRIHHLLFSGLHSSLPDGVIGPLLLFYEQPISLKFAIFHMKIKISVGKLPQSILTVKFFLLGGITACGFISITT